MALPHGVMRIILLCWVCDDCRKEREKQGVLSHAKCPRCDSNDKKAIAHVGDNYNLRCKHCWYESLYESFSFYESWRPGMTKEDKTSPK
jgi:hypothetical protein